MNFIKDNELVLSHYDCLVGDCHEYAVLTIDTVGKCRVHELAYDVLADSFTENGAYDMDPSEAASWLDSWQYIDQASVGMTMESSFLQIYFSKMTDHFMLGCSIEKYGSNRTDTMQAGVEVAALHCGDKKETLIIGRDDACHMKTVCTSAVNGEQHEETRVLTVLEAVDWFLLHQGEPGIVLTEFWGTYSKLMIKDRNEIQENRTGQKRKQNQERINAGTVSVAQLPLKRNNIDRRKRDLSMKLSGNMSEQ